MTVTLGMKKICLLILILYNKLLILILFNINEIINNNLVFSGSIRKYKSLTAKAQAISLNLIKYKYSFIS